MLLFSFGKPQNEYVSSPCTKTVLNRTLCQPESVPEVSLRNFMPVSLLLQKGLGSSVSSRSNANRKRKRRLMGLRPHLVWRICNCQLHGHLCTDALRKASACTNASFCADLQCLSMLLVELEIRSTRQEQPGFLNSGISKTFTNARHVSYPPYASWRSEGNLRKAWEFRIQK